MKTTLKFLLAVLIMGALGFIFGAGFAARTVPDPTKPSQKELRPTVPKSTQGAKLARRSVAPEVDPNEAILAEFGLSSKGGHEFTITTAPVK